MSAVISTLYGDLICKDRLIQDLIASPAFTRLKRIRQYGTCDYSRPNNIPYTRYEHSLGVFALLKRYKRPLNECIAGLLHDISHTVFSHATEGLFNHHEQQSDDSYQDTIHDYFIDRYGISKILSTYGIQPGDVHHKNSHFRALEQKLPDLCADRLEYNLYAGVMDGFLSISVLEPLLEKLIFEDGVWFFTDQTAAHVFAQIPLYETINRWSSPEALLNGLWTSAALKRALEIKLITQEDIHYALTDDVMWDTLTKSQDAIVLKYVERILNPTAYFQWATPSNYTVHLPAKFRGVNPWIQQNGTLNRLTELDREFNVEYSKIKNSMDKGWYLKVF